jgi:succinate dehydrogenase/fumarate reductase flavoprotein subunit
MQHIQPAFVLTFKRLGIDPYTQRFEITLHGEGTVRGIGGLRVVDDGCQTTVSGLYAAGDAASRELIAGATSGGGNQNSAWALSSGVWSGQAAAARARAYAAHDDAPVHALGRAGLRPERSAKPAAQLSTQALVQTVRDELLPYDKVMFRHGQRLTRSLVRLEQAWADVRDHLHPNDASAVAAREAAALVAAARFNYAAALRRAESRGMHQREDRPSLNREFGRRLLVGGLERVWTGFEADSQSVEVLEV